MNIEELLSRPYRIIDILPKQVPANRAEQYFAVDRYFRRKLREKILLQKLSLLLKLNCYADLTLMLPESEETIENPAPEKLRSLVAEQQIYLFAGSALITSDPEDSYMSLYNADEDLLKLVQALAASVGLFVWKPSSDPETSEAGESGL